MFFFLRGKMLGGGGGGVGGCSLFSFVHYFIHLFIFAVLSLTNCYTAHITETADINKKRNFF